MRQEINKTTATLVECPDCGEVFEVEGPPRYFLPDHDLTRGILCDGSGKEGKPLEALKIRSVYIVPDKTN